MRYIKRKNELWLYGKHTCLAALKNMNRECFEIIVSENFFKENKQQIEKYAGLKNVKVSRLGSKSLDKSLPSHVNHQGIALRVSTILANPDLTDIVDEKKKRSTVVVLDQVTDTHNIGSVLRSSACFDVDALILPKHHSPDENASVAKAASGAMDVVPIIYVSNLVKAIEYFKKNSYWCYGFDGEAEKNLEEIDAFADKRVVVFGAEDVGMRRLVRDSCDFVVKIPMSSVMNSLNVSNAAAVALYSIYRQSYYSKPLSTTISLK